MTTQLIQADARRLPLADRSVHCVIADPPYGARRPSDWRPAAERFSEITGNDMVRGDWLREAYRVLVDDAALYVFACWDRLEAWRRLIAVAGFKVRSCIVWDKMLHGLADLKTCWAPRHELILFGSKGRHEFRGGRPVDIIRAMRIDPSVMFHPYQKPERVISPLVEASTVPGETILDPFCGSGTTLVVASALGRRAIGTDLSRDYLGLAHRRINRPHAPVPRSVIEEELPLFAGGAV